MSLLANRAFPMFQRSLASSASETQNGSHTLQRLRNYSSKPEPGTSHKDEEPPQLPKFSLDGLGVSPAMKRFIYAAIGVMATVETYTYGLWIYHKLYPEQTSQRRPEQTKEGS